MRIRKTLLAISALAVAIAFSPELKAATFVSPDTKVSTDNLTVTVAKRKRGGRKAGSKAGHCGTYKYYKKGKCRDARDKK
jgi:hypothetical protein